MTALEKERYYTSDEFLEMTGLPERCELIDGVIYDQAAPSPKHQDIAGGIYSEIREYIRRNKGDCRVFIAPLDVKLDDENTVQPDVLVVCDPGKITDKRCCGAPDWVIEIVSSSDTQRDTVTKLALYAATGVREYWIVFPEEETVLVYLFEAPNTTGIYRFTDDIPVGIYSASAAPVTLNIASILAL